MTELLKKASDSRVTLIWGLRPKYTIISIFLSLGASMLAQLWPPQLHWLWWGGGWGGGGTSLMVFLYTSRLNKEQRFRPCCVKHQSEERRGERRHGPRPAAPPRFPTLLYSNTFGITGGYFQLQLIIFKCPKYKNKHLRNLNAISGVRLEICCRCFSVFSPFHTQMSVLIWWGGEKKKNLFLHFLSQPCRRPQHDTNTHSHTPHACAHPHNVQFPVKQNQCPLRAKERKKKKRKERRQNTGK